MRPIRFPLASLAS